MRSWFLLGGLLLLSGCGDGCQTPSRTDIYAEACRAVATTPGFSAETEFLPIETARIGLGKNAALVDVPFRRRDAAGGGITWKTVHLKRVARTWTVTEVEETPQFPAPAIR